MEFDQQQLLLEINPTTFYGEQFISIEFKFNEMMDKLELVKGHFTPQQLFTYHKMKIAMEIFKILNPDEHNGI